MAVKIHEFNFEKYLHWFSQDIIAKIKSYHFRQDQLTCFTSKLIKYYYLEHYLKNKVIISYNKYSRPYISNLAIDFNISHTKEYLLVAVSNKRIGIDIEEHNENIDSLALGQIVFSDSEQKLIGNNIASFYTIWTKKEALIKAYGFGFANEFYKTTNLTLDKIDKFENKLIYSNKLLQNYYFAICIFKD